MRKCEKKTKSITAHDIVCLSSNCNCPPSSITFSHHHTSDSRIFIAFSSRITNGYQSAVARCPTAFLFVSLVATSVVHQCLPIYTQLHAKQVERERSSLSLLPFRRVCQFTQAYHQLKRQVAESEIAAT